MARMTETTEYVRRTFTVDERLKMADELAAAHNRLADIESEEAVVKAQFKERKAQIEQTVTQHSRNLTTGFEMSNVKCRVEYDKPQVNEVQYVRIDTGEVVKHRAMLPDEMQGELPLGEERSDAKAEQAVQASQEAVEEFFKPGRPTEQPTAETAGPIAEAVESIPDNTIAATVEANEVEAAPEAWPEPTQEPATAAAAAPEPAPPQASPHRSKKGAGAAKSHPSDVEW